jgi:hypothetical protein
MANLGVLIHYTITTRGSETSLVRLRSGPNGIGFERSVLYSDKPWKYKSKFILLHLHDKLFYFKMHFVTCLVCLHIILSVYFCDTRYIFIVSAVFYSTLYVQIFSLRSGLQPKTCVQILTNSTRRLHRQAKYITTHKILYNPQQYRS